MKRHANETSNRNAQEPFLEIWRDSGLRCAEGPEDQVRQRLRLCHLHEGHRRRRSNVQPSSQGKKHKLSSFRKNSRLPVVFLNPNVRFRETNPATRRPPSQPPSCILARSGTSPRPKSKSTFLASAPSQNSSFTQTKDRRSSPSRITTL